MSLRASSGWAWAKAGLRKKDATVKHVRKRDMETSDAVRLLGAEICFPNGV